MWQWCDTTACLATASKSAITHVAASSPPKGHIPLKSVLYSRKEDHLLVAMPEAPENIPTARPNVLLMVQGGSWLESLPQKSGPSGLCILHKSIPIEKISCPPFQLLSLHHVLKKVRGQTIWTAPLTHRVIISTIYLLVSGEKFCPAEGLDQ